MSENTQDAVNPMAYLKIFFRRKELIIIPAILGLVAGICAGLVLPKKYRSSTVILVEEGKTDNPLFDKLAVSSTVEERLTTIQESLLGWRSLVELVKRLGMDKTIKTTSQFEELILGIRRSVQIKLRSHNILELAYIGKDPQETQAVVQNITDIFIERNKFIQNQETADAIVFIEEQLKMYKGKIKSAEIAKLQDQLDELLIDSTEKHPIVRQLKEKLELKRAELKAENLEFTKPDKIETETNNQIIQTIKSALDTMTPAKDPTEKDAGVESDLYKLMLLNTVAARDVEVNEKIYNMLLERLETAKITQRLQLSKEGTRYTVLDPPRIPLSPFQPNKFLVAVGGLLVGVGAGAALIFLLEFLDKSFIDVEEAKEFLGVPLLGAISKINTERSLNKERDQRFWLYTLTAAGGICLIIITMALQVLMK